MERSISRSELRSQQESVSPSPEPMQLDTLDAHDKFEFVQKDIPEAQTVGQSFDEEITFRLFAPSQQAATTNIKDTIQTIRLKSPTPDLKEAGFVVPQRNGCYYFSSSRPSLKARFSATAITAQDVLRLSKLKWQGMSCPWRVLHLPVSGVSKTARRNLDQSWSRLIPGDDIARRKRPGKKARIKMRSKVIAAKRREADAKAAQQARDVADRDKKTRRNREKKVKKRLRDKAKKSAGHIDKDLESDALSEAD